MISTDQMPEVAAALQKVTSQGKGKSSIGYWSNTIYSNQLFCDKGNQAAFYSSKDQYVKIQKMRGCFHLCYLSSEKVLVGLLHNSVWIIEITQASTESTHQHT